MTRYAGFVVRYLQGASITLIGRIGTCGAVLEELVHKVAPFDCVYLFPGCAWEVDFVVTQTRRFAGILSSGQAKEATVCAGAK